MENYRELTIGEVVQVNDIIVEKNALGTNQWTVYKTSDKYCFIKVNDKVSKKYPINYAKIFQMLPKRSLDTSSSKVYRLITK